MKSLILVTLLFASVVARAQESPLTLAVASSLALHMQTDLAPLWGMRAEKLPSNTAARLLYVKDSKAYFKNYGCHATCQALNAVETGLLPPPLSGYTADHFAAAFGSAVDIYRRKVGALEQLEAIKAWQAQGEMYFTLIYHVDHVPRESYFMCHFHGAHIDCHRSLKVGPAEPEF